MNKFYHKFKFIFIMSLSIFILLVMFVIYSSEKIIISSFIKEEMENNMKKSNTL